MKKFYYYSNSGCVKIGNKDFNVMLLNGKGEGSFWIYLYNKNENKKNVGSEEFLAKIINSKLNIYECEKSCNISLSLPVGDYVIFKSKGELHVHKV